MNTLSIELSNLNAFSSDIVGSGLASIYGQPLASVLPDHLQEDWVAAMSAATLSLGAHAARKLALNDIERVIITGRQGYALTVPISEEVILTVMAKPEADLDKLISKTAQAAKSLAALIDAADSDIPAVSNMPEQVALVA